jgi:hypothetical protein
MVAQSGGGLLDAQLTLQNALFQRKSKGGWLQSFQG